jgi:hypothetical protein
MAGFEIAGKGRFPSNSSEGMFFQILITCTIIILFARF